MDTLQAGDDLAAVGATAPRVSFDDIDKAIVREHYFTAGQAVSALGQPTAGPADPLNLLTIGVFVLENGWTVVGKSAPASPENFDAGKGATFAREDAIRQIWPLMGFELRTRLHARENAATAPGAEGADTEKTLEPA